MMHPTHPGLVKWTKRGLALAALLTVLCSGVAQAGQAHLETGISICPKGTVVVRGPGFYLTGTQECPGAVSPTEWNSLLYPGVAYEVSVSTPDSVISGYIQAGAGAPCYNNASTPTINTTTEKRWIVSLKPQHILFTWNLPKKNGRYALIADGQSEASPSAVDPAYPTTSLIWAIYDPNRGCKIGLNSGIITAGTNAGTVVVRAAYQFGDTPCYEETLEIVPKDCDTCTEGQCPVTAKIGKSIDVKINLGWSLLGDTAGFMQVYSAGPENIAALPKQLRCDFRRSDLELVMDSDSSNWIRQVSVPDLLANVVSNSSYYIVELYSPTNVLPKSGRFYQLTNSPYATIRFENPGSDTNRLQVTQIRGSTNVFDYYWLSNGWKLVSGGGLKTEIKTETLSETNTLRTVVYTVQDGTNSPVYQTTEKYRYYGTNWGERLIEQVIGTGGNALTNSFTYYATNYVQQAIYGDGRWQYYVYDSQNRATNVFSGFLNQAVTTNSALCRTLAHTYTTNVISGAGDTGYLEKTRPRQTIEFLLDQEVGRSYFVALPGERRQIGCATPGASWSNANNLVTVTRLFTNGFYQNEIQSVTRPDGTMDFYIYDPLIASPATFNRTNVVLSGHPDGSGTNIDAGARTELIYDVSGKLISKTVTDVPSSITIASETYQYDGFKRLISTAFLDGTSIQNAYQDCCNSSSRTDRDGTVTAFSYDALQRLVTTTKNGVTVSNVYDPHDNLLRSVRYGTNGNAITLNTSTYDAAARKITSQDALSNTTSFSETFDSAGQSIRTATLPNTSTQIETRYRDGTLQRISGTAVHGVRYTNLVTQESSVWRLSVQQFKLDANGNDTSEWTKTYQDGVGHAYKALYSDNQYSQSTFNNQDQLSKEVDPDGVTTLYQYNPKGEREYSALTFGTNIVFAGTDRISSTERDVTTIGGINVLRTRRYEWGTTNSALSNLVSETRISTDGLTTWQITYGLTNKSQILYAGAGKVVITNTAPDGTYSVTTNQSGRIISVTSRDANGGQIGQTLYGYDPHDRQSTATDARNGTTTYGFDNGDHITSVTTPSPDGVQGGQVTTSSYNSMGLITNVVQPDSTSVKTLFHLTGEVATNSGSRTYPAAYTADYTGRPKTLTTWQNFATGAGSALTTWNYDTNRGFLLSKLYADSKGPVYSNSPAGRLRMRTWARGTNATYAFNAIGDLTAITYSSGASNLSFGYDRRGRRTSITNGTDVTTLMLNEAGLVVSESYAGGPLSGLAVTNIYDSLLRRITNGVVDSTGAWLVKSTNGFDSASRLSVVSDGTNSATYVYVSNSPLVSTITFKQNGTNRLITTKTYDFLNRLLQISNAPSADSSLTFNYGYNPANQRTVVTNSDGSRISFGYDQLGQVILARKSFSDGTPVAGQQFEYAFDDIGNRKYAGEGGNEWGSGLRYQNYSVNNLNQYTQRTVPGGVDVIGAANSNATVTLNVTPTVRHGEYFRGEFKTDNRSAAVYQALTNVAVLGTPTNDIITTNTGFALIPKTPELYVHDADGNLATNGLWIFTWDAENRLIALDPAAGVPDAAKKKLRFGYDSQGRRTSKIVSNWTGSAWITAVNIRFAYDGWNLLADLNASNNAVICSYMWGVDLSGSTDGASGVGGLVAVTPIGKGSHFTEFDGNGNVAGLVNAIGGTNSGAYEFGPFGQTIRLSGAVASLNGVRFSSRYTDSETDFIQYPSRSYDSVSGRWLSRDLMEEVGGRNLFLFCGNDPADAVDPLGLLWVLHRDSSEGRAKAWATSEADTFDALAELINLDTKDYRKWVDPPDLKPEVCKKYSIPNTVYVDIGPRSQQQSWLQVQADKISITFIFLRSLAIGTGKLYEENGFKVIKTEPVTAHAIRSHLESSHIYAYVYAGHGANGGINTTEDYSLYPGRYTQYGIRRMVLLACGSAIPLNGKTYTGNVAQRGSFYGSRNNYTALIAIAAGLSDYIWVDLPGTN